MSGPLSGPLTDVRVLDLSRVLAGPSCTQLLGDLGAEVIKVEHPRTGDMTRAWGPPFHPVENEAERGDSAYFSSANRNKRSVTVDFGAPEGASIVRELALQSDVLVENFAYGTLSKYGLGYEDLQGACPKLVYCSITAFGQTGPRRNELGYDLVIQAMSGLMSITGDPAGEPMRSGVAIADITCGLYAAVGILAALADRARTQRGQHIDMALWDSLVASLGYVGTGFLVEGRPPMRLGNEHPTLVPYQQFATRGGHVVIAVGNDAQFERFCAAAGVTELAADSRFQTNAERVRHRTLLIPLLADVVAGRTTAEWVQVLTRAEVPVGPIYTLPEVFADSQARVRQLTTTLRRAGGGEVAVLSNPLRMSRTPVSYRLPPPRLGEHTDDVLKQRLGYTDGQIQAWRRSGVIA